MTRVNEVHETPDPRYAVVGLPGDYNILDRKLCRLSKKRFRTVPAALRRVNEWIAQDGAA